MEPTRHSQQHLLPLTERLRVAHDAARVAALADSLSLFSCLAKDERVGKHQHLLTGTTAPGYRKAKHALSRDY